jgi:phosphatidylserine/phosphatidylglycerophosphate/cardiolipin synthase-like enzyme
MRVQKKSKGLTVNAVGGTHVVALGLNLALLQRKGCLGFAVQREDHTEDERYWMQGMKTFAKTDPGLGPGGTVSTREHPLQTFQWSDYSAKPDHKYTYTVLPLYGTPEELVEGDAVPVDVDTESEIGQKHSIFFNRGAIASQEYARRFQNKSPDKVGAPARKWLSRGLFEAFVAYLERATDATWEIHGAIYEFQWPQALGAVKEAAKRKVKVHILYDGIPGATGPKAKNEDAIKTAKIGAFCKPRTVGKIMHNKFFVLSRNGKPKSVWMGSTNLTENGIFGHFNCGHIIDDAAVAQAYRDYWDELSGNSDRDTERAWVAANNAAPPNPWDDDLSHVFSPRKGLAVLDWYGTIADGAKEGLFMTFAFGMHKGFQKVYEDPANAAILQFALMEKEGNGRALAQGKIDIRRIRKLPNVVVAVGNNIATNAFDRWLAERQKLTAEANVKYVHTKFMLVDPLGEKPIVVTGSANFSEASTDTNHENMVVIRGDTRVADIYMGEFMRLHTHYAFREAVKIAKEQGETDWKPNELFDSEAWQKDYFRPGDRFMRRQYFSRNFTD